MPIMQGDKKVANVYNINNNSYSVPIGCIIPFSGSTIPVGFLLCDGSEVSKIDYADLYAIIADTYGTATDTTKFKLPDLRDRFVQGANGNLGTSKDAGLPDLSGQVGYIKSIGDGAYWQGININTGVFKSSQQTVKTSPTATTAAESTSHSQPPSTVVFKASDSNPIYGNSDTVQPPSVCLSFIIKAEKINDQYAAGVGALIDDTSTATNKVWSAKKVNDKFAMFPFKWKLIGTSTPETGETSSNTFNKTMSSGNPFCVYHSSGIFCFGNGVPANRGKLYGMTSGAVASVTYTTAGLLTVQVGSGTAYIYEMEGIG